MEDQIIETYFDKEEIDKITKKLKNIKYHNLHKSEHFEWSLMNKRTDEDEIERTYFKFENIGLINERKLKYGEVGYDLHYVLDNGTFIVIAICVEKRLLINAFHSKKNFKNFKNNLLEKRRINQERQSREFSGL
jgi:hypothetical protein